jgi:hypothetical protein
MKKLLIVLLLSVHFLYANTEATHQELRELLQGLEKAVNTKQYGELQHYFSPKMKVTMINQEILSGPSQIEPYFNKWFGEKGYLKDVQMKLNADAKTEFYGENMGVVWGSGDEKYILSDTRFFDMKTRWSATVIKEDDGKWRILTLHIGTNFLDNPVSNAIERSLKLFTVLGALAGLVLGLLISFVYIRRKYHSK